MRQAIFVSATPAEYERTHASQVVEQVVRPTGLVDPTVILRPPPPGRRPAVRRWASASRLNERVLVTTLTKRMAEDLTDYLAEHGVKVRYLHSDIDTVERVEIIRDLRRGSSTCWSASTCCARASTSRGVAGGDPRRGQGRLPALGRSLIQTIGAAARHINGTAILYADNMTDSMKAAIEETDRRRAKQVAFNLTHGIEPRASPSASRT
jgi:excinuclease ABC subunit B